jgi:hypothetical protein
MKPHLNTGSGSGIKQLQISAFLDRKGKPKHWRQQGKSA